MSNYYQKTQLQNKHLLSNNTRLALLLSGVRAKRVFLFYEKNANNS